MSVSTRNPVALGLSLIGSALPLHAEEPASLAPVVVTATRIEQSSFDLPIAIDTVDRAQIQDQQLRVNISETLNRVPGTVVPNRENYTQEQQVVLRGVGARSQFGVRGIKLLADGIPASTPDGQGGTGLFDLASAARIEVMRGAFSALYGNHAGGVVQIFTEDGPPRPTVSADAQAGSYDTWRAGLKFGGQSGNLNYIASASRYDTDGYRDWSAARKDQFNAKLRVQADPKSSLTLVANYLNQPDNLDPLGLTAEQVEQDRRQANPAALQFQTRRSLDNLQGGLVYEAAVSDVDTLRGIVYAGKRSNEQFLAIPLAVQNGVTQSGGDSTIDRDFWGAGLRWTRRLDALILTSGADYEYSKDDRKGFLNNLGVQGALKRDEENSVYQAGAYVQAQWQLAKDWNLSAGLRYTAVDFDSSDHFICTPALVTAPGTAPNTCSGSTNTIGQRQRVVRRLDAHGRPAVPADAGGAPVRQRRSRLRDAHLRRTRLPAGRRHRAEPRPGAEHQQPVRGRGEGLSRHQRLSDRGTVRSRYPGRDRHLQQRRRARHLPERGRHPPARRRTGDRRDARRRLRRLRLGHLPERDLRGQLPYLRAGAAGDHLRRA